MRTVIPLILELAVIPLILVFGQDPPSKRTSQFRTLGFGAGTEATVDASGNVKFYELPHRAGDDSSALEVPESGRRLKADASTLGLRRLR